MNSRKMLTAAVLLGALISSSLSVSAAVTGAKHGQSALSTVPHPSKVVAPEGLPRRFAGTTVKITFTVDENGQPRDISAIKPNDRDLARSLVPALSQWRFTPAQENGVPVAKRVMLPITLSTDS